MRGVCRCPRAKQCKFKPNNKLGQVVTHMKAHKKADQKGKSVAPAPIRKEAASRDGRVEALRKAGIEEQIGSTFKQVSISLSGLHLWLTESFAC